MLFRCPTTAHFGRCNCSLRRITTSFAPVLLGRDAILALKQGAEIGGILIARRFGNLVDLELGVSKPLAGLLYAPSSDIR